MLGMFGGYVSYVNTYSAPVLPVITPHVLGDARPLASAWPTIVQHSTLVVLIGTDPLITAEILSGGDGAHLDKGWLTQLRDKRTPVVSVNPLGTEGTIARRDALADRTTLPRFLRRREGLFDPGAHRHHRRESECRDRQEDHVADFISGAH
jgi:hypothetical protein